MSSILKALKRLEEEKSGQGEETPLQISRAILKSEPRAGIKAGWFWLLAVSATAIILFLSSALYRNSEKTAASSAPGLQAAAVATPTPAAITAAPTSSPPAVSRPDKKSLPVPQTAGSRQKTAAAPDLPKTAAIQKPAPPKTAPLPLTPQKTDLEQKAVTAPPVPSRKVPSLTLSGIAWNMDSADRLAIINGQPIATGAVVSGVLVKEILQDKVILSNDGQVFELLIGRDAKTN